MATKAQNLRTSNWRLVIIAALGLWCLGVAPADAAPPTLPENAAEIHLGVASCAGSTCHGAVVPWQGSNVLQNEHVTWKEKDPHSRAYKVLLDERGVRIARNLGLPDAASAPECLSCHSDNVAADKRGTQFQVADGVGCEACHGGSVRWLGIHASGVTSHAQNVENGLYPTEDPQARAALCLTCHVGDSTHVINHRIMGAGHPRLRFELDTFTWAQPAHFRIDDDYRKRKTVVDGIKTWAIGQVMALELTLDGIADAKRGRDGAFPELVWFDCQACHHVVPPSGDENWANDLRWRKRAGTGLGPGVSRLNDANFIMLRVALGRIDPSMASSLREQTLALHAASRQGPEALTKAAQTLKATATRARTAIAAHAFGKADVAALIQALVAEGRSGELIDFGAAEQTTMALSALLAASKDATWLSEAQFTAMNTALGQCYDAVQADRNFSTEAFLTALNGFAAAVPQF